MTEFLADYVFVTFTGLGIAALAALIYVGVSDEIKNRKALKQFREYEKTQDEPVAKARRGGL
jgi:hypothetical protein